MYDGTFAGFLSVIYRIYHDGTGQMESISALRESENLFREETKVLTDINHMTIEQNTIGKIIIFKAFM